MPKALPALLTLLFQETEWAEFTNKGAPVNLWCLTHAKVAAQLYPNTPKETVASMYHDENDVSGCRALCHEAAENIENPPTFDLPATITSTSPKGTRLCFEVAFVTEVRLTGSSSKFLRLQSVNLQGEQRGTVLTGFLISLRGLPLDEILSLRRVQIFRETALTLSEANLQPSSMIHERHPQMLADYLSQSVSGGALSRCVQGKRYEDISAFRSGTEGQG